MEAYLSISLMKEQKGYIEKGKAALFLVNLQQLAATVYRYFTPTFAQ